MTYPNLSLRHHRLYLQLGSFLPTAGEIRVTNGMAVSITSSAINENVNASCSAVDITNKVRDKENLKYIIFRINVIRLYRGSKYELKKRKRAFIYTIDNPRKRGC